MIKSKAKPTTDVLRCTLHLPWERYICDFLQGRKSTLVTTLLPAIAQRVSKVTPYRHLLVMGTVFLVGYGSVATRIM